MHQKAMDITKTIGVDLLVGVVEGMHQVINHCFIEEHRTHVNLLERKLVNYQKDEQSKEERKDSQQSSGSKVKAFGKEYS